MKKQTKKLLIGIAAIMLMMCMLCFGASAIDETGKCGENVHWNYDETTDTLVISGEGPMYDYHYSAGNYSPFRYIRTNASVIIEEGVTHIGNYAFYESCIKSIKIPDSVTSIGVQAFYYCSYLEDVNIPRSVTSIGSYAFSYCWSLKNIVIPRTVTSWGTGVFEYSQILNLMIEEGVTALAKSMFDSCWIPDHIIIPDSVTTIGDGAFRNCGNLSSVTIGKGVTSIGNSVFYECDKLTDIEIPDNVTSIGENAFGYCSKLTNIELSDSITSIEHGTFYTCENLTNVIIPATVTHIGENAFKNCYKLSDIVIPASVTNIEESAFEATDITTAHYCGTQEQWNKIIIRSYNTTLTRNVHMSEDKDINGFCDVCGYEIFHTHNYVLVSTTPPTCTENGQTVYTCSCGDSYSEIIPTTGHDYQNGICTKCSDSKIDDCSHLCHKSGFMGFIWKIINFFSKLFKINPVCECGAAHY